MKQSDVTICLVSDKVMARLNLNFRKKKGPTDVLSFPAAVRRRPGRLSRKPKAARSANGEYLGDIAISHANSRRYARKNDRPLPSELRVLILHGVLHLLGYDHETDHGEMDEIEQKFRKRFGLA